MNCPNCQKQIEPGFKLCPYCGTETNISTGCPSCKKEVKPDWMLCPYCGTTLSQRGFQQHIPKPFSPPVYEKGHGHHGGSSGKHRKKGFLGGFFSS